MSASKPSPSGAHKRLPYNRPALTKLTPEEAKAMLEAKSILGDKQAQQLTDAIKLRLGERNDKRAKER